MAIVRDQFASNGVASVWIVYNDARAVDDPNGPRGNRWIIDDCPLVRIEVETNRDRDFRVQVRIPNQDWSNLQRARRIEGPRAETATLDPPTGRPTTVGEIEGISIR
jgi:hypothetical protein